MQVDAHQLDDPGRNFHPLERLVFDFFEHLLSSLLLLLAPRRYDFEDVPLHDGWGN